MVNIYVMKIDANENKPWTKSAGSNDYAKKITAADNGYMIRERLTQQNPGTITCKTSQINSFLFHSV